MYPSAGIIYDESQSISRRLKDTSITFNSLRKKWGSKHDYNNDRELYDRLGSISRKVSEIHDELVKMGRTLDEEVNPEDIGATETVTITSKEFVLLQNVFGIYTGEVMGTSDEKNAIEEPELKS